MQATYSRRKRPAPAGAGDAVGARAVGAGVAKRRRVRPPRAASPLQRLTGGDVSWARARGRTPLADSGNGGARCSSGGGVPSAGRDATEAALLAKRAYFATVDAEELAEEEEEEPSAQPRPSMWQLASPPPLPPSSALAPRRGSLGGAAAPSENTPPPPPGHRRAALSYGAAGEALRLPAASPAPSCSGMSRTPRHVIGSGAACAPPRQRPPPQTGPARPHAPPRRATLSASADDVAAAAPPPGPSAPSVSAGDVSAGRSLALQQGPTWGDAGVAAAACSSEEDHPGLDADAPRGLSAPDEEWLAPPQPAPSSAAEAPMSSMPPPPPAGHVNVQQPRRRSSSGGGAAEPARCSSGGDALMALLMNAADEDAAALRARCSLPRGYRIHDCVSFAEPALQSLSAAFAAEDERVGILPRDGAAGGTAGSASLLMDERGEAVGYVLHFANAAPPWERGAAAALPPRLAHLYIAAPHRRRGLGSALLAWWRERHAAAVRLFAVDSPNDAMASVLARLACAPAATRSGHAASAVHYLHVPSEGPGLRTRRRSAQQEQFGV